MCSFMGICRVINTFQQSTLWKLSAPIADIRRLGELPASFLFIGDAGRKTSAVKFTGATETVGACLADAEDIEFKAQGAVIKGFA